MANTFTPFGFSPVRRIDGAAWADSLTPRLIAAANTHKFFRGDPVVILSTGYIDTVTGSSSMSHTYDMIGIFWGCEFQATSSGSPWSPTYPGAAQTVDTKALIITDPNVVFRVQMGTGAAPGSAGGPAVLADLNTTFPWLTGTGNANNGISGAYLDYANKNTTSTLPFMLTALVADPPGVNGTDTTTAGNLVECVMNQAIWRVGQTGE